MTTGSLLQGFWMIKDPLRVNMPAQMLGFHVVARERRNDACFQGSGAANGSPPSKKLVSLRRASSRCHDNSDWWRNHSLVCVEQDFAKKKIKKKALSVRLWSNAIKMAPFTNDFNKRGKTILKKDECWSEYQPFSSFLHMFTQLD